MDMKKSNRKTRWIDCYNSSQKILLVGEGDFSFSACLARAFGTAKNMVATSYLDQDSLVEKHWTGVQHLKELEILGCLLLCEVDVWNMNTHSILKNTKFDIIIFNFPHAGHYDYLCERDVELIQMHRELVGAYFRSASKMLSEGGEVHIRHRDDYPYHRWRVVSLAAKVGLKLKEKVLFCKSLYPGYHQKRGGGINTNKTFPIEYAFTFKFALDLPKVEEIYVHVLEMKDHVHKQHTENDKGLHEHKEFCFTDAFKDDDDDDNDESNKRKEFCFTDAIKDDNDDECFTDAIKDDNDDECFTDAIKGDKLNDGRDDESVNFKPNMLWKLLLVLWKLLVLLVKLSVLVKLMELVW